MIIKNMPVSKKKAKPKLRPKKRKRESSPQGENFEKIVAAIHVAEMQGAVVTWNEIIQGRQFDVAIRFKVGFYEYLTLIECKDYSKPVSVEKVEAFVTKVRHQKANKAIMVSAHGFQSGAKEVASREGIELYSLRQINKLPDDVLTGIFLSFVVVQPFVFRTDGEAAFVFSQDPIKLQNQINKIKFTNYGDKSIGDLLRPFSQLVSPVSLPGVPDIEKTGFPWKRATSTPQKTSWNMMDNTMMIDADSGKKIHVKEFLFLYWAEKVNLSNKGGIDPTVFSSFGIQYEYKNELNNEVTVIDPINLKMGIGTVLEVGKFYTQPQFKNFIYYCERIEGEIATIFLLKSFQHGRLVRMEQKQPISTSEDYVEITNESEIKEAKELYKDFVNRRNEYPPQIVYADAAIWF